MHVYFTAGVTIVDFGTIWSVIDTGDDSTVSFANCTLSRNFAEREPIIHADAMIDTEPPRVYNQHIILRLQGVTLSENDAVQTIWSIVEVGNDTADARICNIDSNKVWFPELKQIDMAVLSHEVGKKGTTLPLAQAPAD